MKTYRLHEGFEDGTYSPTIRTVHVPDRSDELVVLVESLRCYFRGDHSKLLHETFERAQKSGKMAAAWLDEDKVCVWMEGTPPPPSVRWYEGVKPKKTIAVKFRGLKRWLDVSEYSPPPEVMQRLEGMSREELIALCVRAYSDRWSLPFAGPALGD